jgi:NitT/TauT family transport system permease protein
MNVPRIHSSKLLPAASFIGFLVIWELVARAGWISNTFFPPPTKIGASFIKLATSGELFSATGATLLRFLAGFVAGSALGAVLGLMMGWWPRFHDFMDPFIGAIYPIPKIAMFPLLMIIFGIGEGSKFVAILLAAFFPVLINSLIGVRQISKVYFEVGKNYGVKGRNVFTHILLPGSLPSLMSGLLQAANIAFVIAISVEIISSRNGLGVLLWFGWQTFRVSELYAVLVVISVLGIALNYLFGRLTRALVPWMGE